MKLPQTGGCLCGKIRYEISEEPQLTYTCHCVDCQRLTSSAFSMAIVVPDGAFRLAGIEPRAIQRTADSGGVVTRWVCPECGSWVCGASSSDNALPPRAGRHAGRYILAAPDSAFLDAQQAALDYAATGRSDFRGAASHINSRGPSGPSGFAKYTIALSKEVWRVVLRHSTQIVIGLLVAVGFEGLGLVIGIEDHIGKSTDITIIAPPSGSEHRIKAIGTLARWRFAFESGFEPRPHTRQTG